MSTPEPNDKPPEPPPEPIKLEPQPVPPRSVGGPTRHLSTLKIAAVILCSLLPLLPALAMSEANYYWVWVLPVVIGCFVVGFSVAEVGPREGHRQAITVAIVILIPLALFAYLFVVCSNTALW